MADVLKGLFANQNPSLSPTPSPDDADFIDFASAPDLSSASVSPMVPSSVNSPLVSPTLGVPRPYTKWYRIWERTTPRDFVQEIFILPIILIIVLVHTWGTRFNRRKAKSWVIAHSQSLQQEYASVGFGGRKNPSMSTVQAEGLLKAGTDEKLANPEELLKEKAANEYISYATGRQNVAFLDIKLSLIKRYNPFARFAEIVIGFFFESLPAPEERMEATAYVFDGKESQLVPKRGPDSLDQYKIPSSSYDGFVWAIVHKNLMRALREERYDLSLTSTRDHPKLPNWATVMSESAEITEILLTPELIRAIELAGEALEALIVTDQPIDQPKKLDEAVPSKRISLSLRLPPSSSSYSNTLPLFNYFLRFPDHLVLVAHFRPEALRRVRQTREDEIRRIRKLDVEEKNEERKLRVDKEKKEKRDTHLKTLSAEEQRKFLEKERAKEMRRGMQKKTMRA